MHVEPHHTPEELQTSPQLSQRLRGIILAVSQPVRRPALASHAIQK